MATQQQAPPSAGRPLPPTPPPGPLSITILNPETRTVFVLSHVYPSDTIGYIKLRLQQEYPGAPPIADQRLIFVGLLLDDSQTIATIIDCAMPPTPGAPAPPLNFHLVVSRPGLSGAPQQQQQQQQDQNHQQSTQTQEISNPRRSVQPPPPPSFNRYQQLPAADLLHYHPHAYTQYFHNALPPIPTIQTGRSPQLQRYAPYPGPIPPWNRFPYPGHYAPPMQPLARIPGDTAPPQSSIHYENLHHTVSSNEDLERLNHLHAMEHFFEIMLGEEAARLGEGARAAARDAVRSAVMNIEYHMLQGREAAAVAASPSGPSNSVAAAQAIPPAPRIPQPQVPLQARNHRQNVQQQGQRQPRQLVFHFELNWGLLLRLLFVAFLVSQGADISRFYVLLLVLGLTYLWQAGHLNILRRITQLVLPTPNDLLQAMFPQQQNRRARRDQQEQQERQQHDRNQDPQQRDRERQQENNAIAANDHRPFENEPQHQEFGEGTARRAQNTEALPEVNAEPRTQVRREQETENNTAVEQPNRLLLGASLIYSFLYGFICSLLPAWTAEAMPNIRNWLRHNGNGENEDDDDRPNANAENRGAEHEHRD